MKFLHFCGFIFFLFGCGQGVTAQDHLQKFDSMAQEVNRIGFFRGDKAKVLIEEMYDIAHHSEDSSTLIARCLYHEIATNSFQGIYDSTLTHEIFKRIELTNAEKQPFECALLYYALGADYVIKGSYTEAFATFLHTLGLFKSIDNKYFIAKTYIGLGNICNYIENFDMAELYFQQALDFITPDQMEYYQIYFNLYISWAYTGKIEQSIDAMLQLVPVLENRGDTGLLVSTFLNLGFNYMIIQHPEKAFPYYQIAKNMAQTMVNDRFLASLYRNIGAYYMEEQKFQTAYKHFLMAERFSSKVKSPTLISFSLHDLFIIHEKLGNNDSALFYLKKYEQVKETMSNYVEIIDIYQAYTSLLVESSNKELKITEQALSLKNKQITNIIIISIAIILLLASLLIIIQQKKRHQSAIKEAKERELKEQLKHEQDVQKIQKRKIEVQIREITSYSMLLSCKNQILQQIENVTQKGPFENETVSESSREIKRIIKNNLHAEKDWNDFMIHFNKVHPDFFHKLKAHCQDLTENNLRMCAYFRMGMPSKNIAQLLNISLNSIKVHRYRLKKKLGLSEEESLDDFLRNV